jgi:hypothetical protein
MDDNETTTMKVYKKDIERVKNHGIGGDSLAKSLSRALDKLEGKK